MLYLCCFVTCKSDSLFNSIPVEDSSDFAKFFQGGMLFRVTKNVIADRRLIVLRLFIVQLRVHDCTIRGFAQADGPEASRHHFLAFAARRKTERNSVRRNSGGSDGRMPEIGPKKAKSKRSDAEKKKPLVVRVDLRKLERIPVSGKRQKRKRLKIGEVAEKPKSKHVTKVQSHCR